MGVPACLWRRTGEIYKGNREFSELVGVDGYMMRDVSSSFVFPHNYRLTWPTGTSVHIWTDGRGISCELLGGKSWWVLSVDPRLIILFRNMVKSHSIPRRRPFSHPASCGSNRLSPFQEQLRSQPVREGWKEPHSRLMKKVSSVAAFRLLFVEILGASQVW